MNAGALLDAETPNQIIGVLAHETGHIAGGHLARLREQLAAASTQSILAMIFGIGAMVAGSRTGNSSLSEGGMAALAGQQLVESRYPDEVEILSDGAQSGTVLRVRGVAGPGQ